MEGRSLLFPLALGFSRGRLGGGGGRKPGRDRGVGCRLPGGVWHPVLLCCPAVPHPRPPRVGCCPAPPHPYPRRAAGPPRPPFVLVSSRPPPDRDAGRLVKQKRRADQYLFSATLRPRRAFPGPRRARRIARAQALRPGHRRRRPFRLRAWWAVVLAALP